MVTLEHELKRNEPVLSRHEESVKFGVHCMLEVVDVIEDVCGCLLCSWT